MKETKQKVNVKAKYDNTEHEGKKKGPRSISHNTWREEIHRGKKKKQHTAYHIHEVKTDIVKGHTEGRGKEKIKDTHTHRMKRRMREE